MVGPQAGPTDSLNQSDPGDQTQRNFRYQHAYGVILLVQAALGELPYTTLWCEQHEDFLGQRDDDRFDAWQIKTRKPENGPWHLGREELVASLGRFCDLVRDYDDRIVDLFFASNAAFDTVTDASRDAKRRGRCPQLFLNHIQACASVDEIEEPFREPFDALTSDTGADSALLFNTLQRTHLVEGPGRRDFEAALMQNHVGRLPICAGWSVNEVVAFGGELMRAVANASALVVLDGRRDVRAVDGTNSEDPVLVAKQIVVSSLSRFAPAGAGTIPFQVQQDPVLAVPPVRPPNAGARLRQKLAKGGLDEDQISDFEILGRSAEFHLMQEAARRPEVYRQLQSDIEAAVLHECRQAHLRAKQGGAPFGERLMIDLQDRLERMATESPTDVWRESGKCLIGVAALLTDECRVWFSDRFDISNAPETTL